MSVVGTWNLFYSWGCGSYTQTTITFNNDGTFSDGQGNSGTWSQREGTLIFIYPAYITAYAGNVVHGSITGMSYHEPSRTTGCWYATSQAVGLTSDDKARRGPSMSGAELSKSA